MPRLNTLPARALKAALLAVLMSGTSAQAQESSPPVFPMSEVEHSHPELPPILPLRDRAEVIDRILEERLDTIIPQIMREQGVSMWVLMARSCMYPKLALKTKLMLSPWMIRQPTGSIHLLKLMQFFR